MLHIIIFSKGAIGFCRYTLQKKK